MISTIQKILIVIIAISSSHGVVIASEQNITLNPGWNAVFLEIEPIEKKWGEILKDTPIASVRTWNPKADHVEFIQDPNELLPDSPNWLSFFPSSNPVSFLNNLFVAEGGRAYLIQLEGTKEFELKIDGKSVLPEIKWKPNSFNLVGFYLVSGFEPFFQQFFEPSSALANQEIYRLNRTGIWEKLFDTDTTQMKSGEAFWIYCKEYTEYTGPLSVSVEQALDLDFGKTVMEHTIKIVNLVPNNPSSVELKGNLPLSYWVDPPEQNAGWNDMTNSVSVGNVGIESTKLRLAIRRMAMDESTDTENSIEVSNGEGMRIIVPVSAEKNEEKTGLWVGTVEIQKVSQSYDKINPNLLKPVKYGFQFRLILHVNSNGVSNLLKEVVQMWKDGETVPYDTGEGNIVTKPGRHVLITDDALLSQFEGSILKNGHQVGQRISTAVFGFSDPQNMSGNFPVSLNTTINLSPFDPTNPFKHKYHPDHDNLDVRFEVTIEEAYEISRFIQLDFTDADPEIPSSISSVSWGSSVVGGVYRETLTGLHKKQIHVEGVFRLNRINNISQLNDGL